MAEYDYVISSLKVKENSVFRLADLYKVMKSWFDDHNYLVLEGEYGDVDKKHADIKWTAIQKVDDYSNFIIEARLKASNLEHMEVRGKKLDKGEIEVTFASYIKSDTEDYWAGKGTSIFLRGIYDKFSLKNKMDKYHDKLKEDTYGIYDEVKSYLKLHVLR